MPPEANEDCQVNLHSKFSFIAITYLRAEGEWGGAGRQHSLSDHTAITVNHSKVDTGLALTSTL